MTTLYMPSFRVNGILHEDAELNGITGEVSKDQKGDAIHTRY